MYSYEQLKIEILIVSWVPHFMRGKVPKWIFLFCNSVGILMQKAQCHDRWFRLSAIVLWRKALCIWSLLNAPNRMVTYCVGVVEWSFKSVRQNTAQFAMCLAPIHDCKHSPHDSMCAFSCWFGVQGQRGADGMRGAPVRDLFSCSQSRIWFSDIDHRNGSQCRVPLCLVSPPFLHCVLGRLHEWSATVLSHCLPWTFNQSNICPDWPLILLVFALCCLTVNSGPRWRARNAWSYCKYNHVLHYEDELY